MDFEKIGVIAVRMLRAFVIGFVGSALYIVPTNIAAWGDVLGWLNALGMAGVVGGIVAVISGFEKWARWEE